MRRLVFLSLFASSAGGGCTFAPGEFFGEVDLSLEALFETPASRDAGDGWQKLDTDYQVKLTVLALDIAAVKLIDFGSAALSFDPANPPPGYSLCHNGHCHGDDGGLYTYEEIEEELAGSAGGENAALTVPVGAVDLLEGFAEDLECDEACGLPESEVRRVHAVASSLSFTGLVRDSRVPARIPGEIPWTAVLDVPESAGDGAPRGRMIGTLDLPVDRAHAPEITLALEIHPTAALFDGVDFAALTTSGSAIDFAAPQSAAALDILFVNLGEVEIETHISR